MHAFILLALCIAFTYLCVQATLIKAAQGVGLLVPGALYRLLEQCVEEQGALLVAQRAELQERVGLMYTHTHIHAHIRVRMRTFQRYKVKSRAGSET